MIFKNGQPISEIHQNIKQFVDNIQQLTERSIGAVYKGSQLVWLTVTEAIKSCYGSGNWLSEKPWLNDDYWKY